MRPHVTDEEYRQTEFIAQQFASGVGKDLQKKLLEKAKKERNWVREKIIGFNAYINGKMKFFLLETIYFIIHIMLF